MIEKREPTGVVEEQQLPLQGTVRPGQEVPLPSSLLCVEKVFSITGNIYEEKRSSLKGENAEKLCFLHYNLPLLKWQY